MVRDNTKYLFEGREYYKNSLVLAVIKAYMRDNPNTTYNKLKETFPDELNSKGVFQTIEYIKQKNLKDPDKRFFMGKKDMIITGDGKTTCVTTQWGDTIGRHREFVRYVIEKLNYVIEKVD